MRFDLPLQRLTTKAFTKKWFPRFFCLRGCHLYHSDGKNGHPDTQDGTLAFMRSKPAPDSHYCVDVQGKLMRVACFGAMTYLLAGCSVAACSAPVDGQAFAFEITLPAGSQVHC